MRRVRRLRPLAPWLAGLVLLAGVVVGAIRLFPGHDAPQQPAPPVQAAPSPAPKPKTAALSKDATSVAREFVMTAVARRHLDAAWKISGPDIRGGLTYKQWLRGEIPVVPYPVQDLRVAPFKIDYSYANAVGLDVALLPRNQANIKPQIFFIELKKIHGRWIVTNWVPHSAPVVPVSGQ
jgi:hypothetical protein